MNKKTVFVLIMLISFLVAGCGFTPRQVTMEKFNKVQPGMSYSLVVEIVGASGELGVSSQSPAIPGIMQSIEHKIYTWKNSDGSNMVVQFENNRVIVKAQAGL